MTTSMEHSKELAELLRRRAFRRHPLARNSVGHFQLVGQLGDRSLDILLDTGAASTVVDLGYCASQGIATRRRWSNITYSRFGRSGFNTGRIASSFGRHLRC